MRAAAALILVFAFVAPASAAPPPFGGLTELPGCISADGNAGACGVGHQLSADGYPESAMSPDGRNVYISASNDNAVAALALDAVSGALAQLPGTGGCTSADGSGGQCVTGTGLISPAGAAVSPDGRNVYTGLGDDAAGGVAAFERSATGGALSQLSGTAACINENGSLGCQLGNGLADARSVALSPDGLNVYVASNTDNAVAAFSRDRVTGDLHQLPGSAGCITSGTASGCAPGIALGDAWSVAVSPDGANVYVVSDVGNSVAVFSRDASTGALTQLPGTAACVSSTGSGGMCTPDPLASRLRSVAFSPDGAEVYIASLVPGAVLAFSRSLSNGALTQIPGPGGCVSDTGSGGSCADGTALANANGVTVSPDGRSLYVASIDATNAVLAFDRDPASGQIAQLPGQAGCTSEDGTGGACVDGVGLRLATWPMVTSDGRHVVVTGIGNGNAATFSRELPPVCSPFRRTVVAGASTRLALQCSDPNGDPITRSITTTPAHGKLGALDQALGNVLYTPARGFLGADSLSFAASDGTLTSAPAGAGLTVRDSKRPVISRASISPRKFAAAGAHAARVRRGTKIRYRLSERASVTFTVQRKHKRRWVKVGSFKQSGKAGRNTKRFSGRLHRKALKPGAYRVVLRAADPSHNRSKQRRLRFRLLPAR
jgi:DNA-binding beta-propeller fold protein YncE